MTANRDLYSVVDDLEALRSAVCDWMAEPVQGVCSVPVLKLQGLVALIGILQERSRKHAHEISRHRWNEQARNETAAAPAVADELDAEERQMKLVLLQSLKLDSAVVFISEWGVSPL